MGERKGRERNRRRRGKIDKKRREREGRRVWTDWSNMNITYPEKYKVPEIQEFHKALLQAISPLEHIADLQ